MLYKNTIVTFGRYWEGSNLESVPLQWLVLEETKDYYLVVSNQAIISKRFDETTSKWKESDIRKWLNNEFVELAFNRQEQACIITTEITTINDPYLTWGGKSSNPTVVSVKSLDKVFLLSTDEVEKYFKTKKSRMVDFSQCALDTLSNSKNLIGIWWLRNEEELGWGPVRIMADGSYDGEENLADEDPANFAGIRPAAYINKDLFANIMEEK